MTDIYQLLSLRGKVALVTGGAGYLGTAICETLAELGAHVIIASRDLKKCEEKCKEIESSITGAKATAMVLDLMDKQSIFQCFQQIKSDYNGVDILVNNAWSGNKNSFESISDEDWQYDIEMSMTSVFRCVKEALPGLVAKKGVILNITSMYGHVAPDYRIYDGVQFTNPPSYGAAKAGVIQFSKYLASFLSPYGIRVNCLSPGAFPHPVTQQHEEFIRHLSEKNPMNRIGDPDEIKGAVALLCSDASSYMTGQHVCVDGGWTVW
ncbi:SDR family NAD(P)-dependent oxidoreductase [Paenibacillus sp. Soil522]|uniref:SDR family NAD(P)-dependent oxidoreductase n=1 Tax=Paenibacillus sp. Soil522 TaxID=1736388 RepID=UPI0006F6E4DC|nr:SDR family oxidoreductase [Paenibacillus sp. Soil522]KRE46295.1 short-chain dehydrogenase [Paenibacillus sp. Soil522]